MATRAAVLSLVAIAGLGACATYDSYPPSSAPAVSTAPASGAIVTVPVATVTPGTVVAPGTVVTPVTPVASTFRTGNGVIESIAMTRLVAPVSASAGSSASNVTAYRLTVRMDDGTVQTIDQDNRAFMVGDRIQITSDGHVRR